MLRPCHRQLLVTLLTLFLAGNCQVRVWAQGKPVLPSVKAEITGDGWEFASMQADRVAVLGQGHPNETIFIVSRRAPGERSSLAWRRLRSARSYLSSDRGIPNTIVLADGETVRGQGTIQFYFGGSLVATIVMGRQRNLYFWDGPQTSTRSN